MLVNTEHYDFERRPVLEQPPERAHFWKRVTWRFSAATAAIHWLRSIPLELRLQLRDLLLLEDHESVAHPECHGLGFIPFCVENSRLHVERRVSQWRSILPAGSDASLWDVMIGDNPRDLYPLGCDALRSETISDSFRLWITGALALPAAGMPLHSLSLVFDGHPTLEQSSNVFEIVKLEASLQRAKEYQEERWPESSADQGSRGELFEKFETFP